MPPTARIQKSSPTRLMALCLALAFLVSSCGGGSSSPDSSGTPPTQTTATLVVVLAEPSPPVSVAVDGKVLAENLSYMTSTNPLIVSSGDHQLLLENSQGASASNTQPLSLQPGSHTTVLYIFPAVFGPLVQVMTDDATPAPNSMAKLRVANFANNAVVNGPYDVYVVPFGSAPSGSPFATNLGSQSPVYQPLAPGNYDVYFTTEQNPGGPPPTVLYHTGSLQLAANQNRSVYFLTTCQDPTGGGCIPNGFTTVTVADLN